MARIVASLWCVVLLLASVSSFAADSTGASGSDANLSGAKKSLFQQLLNGQVAVIMRHALAPGNGDPAHFDGTDCSTQRNLSQQGIEQAERIGSAFKSHGIESAALYTSLWCRCVDTATGLGIGTAEPLAALNSFYQDRSTALAQTDSVSQFIKLHLEKHKSNPIVEGEQKALVLVTHQVNITALTNVFPSSGELVFVRLGVNGSGVNGLHVVDTLHIP